MAKVLIDISEHNLNVIKRFIGGDGVEELPPRIIEDLIRSAYLGIALDGLTNGEVLMKMFLDATVEQVHSTFFDKEVLRVTKDGNFIVCDLDWWNRKWGE